MNEKKDFTAVDHNDKRLSTIRSKFWVRKSVKVDLTISLTQKWTDISVRKHYILSLGLPINKLSSKGDFCVDFC